MKKNILFILIVFALSKVVFGQDNEALLYNSKAQLRADTTLIITQEQLNKWKPVEEYLINFLVTQIEYSQMATESNLSGTSVVSFIVDSTGKIIDFKTIRQVGGGLEEVVKQHLKLFNMLTNLASKNINNEYFLAFSFQLVDADSYIRKEKSIPIIKVKKDLIIKY